MINKLRTIIDNNRIYAWMIIFILLMHAYALFFNKEIKSDKKEHIFTREEFKIEVEAKKELLQKLLQKDQGLAFSLGYIFLFIFSSMVTGSVFLADYVIKKLRDKKETIPKTLRAEKPLWAMADVLRIIIIFIFFNHLFSAIVKIATSLFFLKDIDRRLDMVMATTLLDFTVLLCILSFVVFKYRQGISTLGISLKSLYKNIGIAIYSYIAFLPILTVALFLIFGIARLFNYTPPPEPIYELMFKEARPLLLVIISFLVSIAGPVIEEVFFRGFLYGALRKRLNFFLAMFISGLLFSALHTNLLGLVPILLLGMFLAYLKEKTGSLIPSISVHILHNTILASLMFLIRFLTAKAAQLFSG